MTIEVRLQPDLRGLRRLDTEIGSIEPENVDRRAKATSRTTGRCSSSHSRSGSRSFCGSGTRVDLQTDALISIALVDDHRVVSRSLKAYLESFPDLKVVGIASSGEELLGHLDDWKPQVVVQDLLMPGG